MRERQKGCKPFHVRFGAACDAAGTVIVVGIEAKCGRRWRGTAPFYEDMP